MFPSSEVGAAEPAPVDMTRRPTEGITRSHRNAIVVLLAGAMSQMDSFDYKPDAPGEFRGPFTGVPTKTGNAVYSELFPKLAEMDDQYALLRAMTVTDSGVHSTAYRNWLQTPDGTHLVTALGRNARQIPYVNAVTPGVFPVFKSEHDSELELSQSIRIEWDEKQKGYIAQSVKITEGLTQERLNDRLSLRGQLDRSSFTNKQTQRVDALRDQALHILNGSALTVLNSMGSSNDKDREAFGDNPYGEIMEFAGRMADPDQGDTRLVVVEAGSFDHHWDVRGRMTEICPQLDQAVAELIRRYSDRVVIAMRGEYGRTPKLNSSWKEGPGRDHWPIHAGILAGPTVEPGTYGQTCKTCRNVTEGEITNKDFSQAFFQATGDIADRRSPLIKGA
jgi:hypothetical protein